MFLENQYSLGSLGFPPGIRGPIFGPPGLGPYDNSVMVQPAEIYDPTGQSQDFPSRPTGKPNMAYFTKLIRHRRRKGKKKKGFGMSLGAYEDFLPYGLVYNDPDFIYRYALGGAESSSKPLCLWLLLAAAGAYLLTKKR